MLNKEMIIDFINYGIIAAVFLVLPYSTIMFLAIIIHLIYDLITLYIVERKEEKDSFDFESEYRYDHWED